MRVLPRVVVPLPVVGITAIGVTCLLGVTGCAQFDKALGQRQALVSFRNGTPAQVRLQVREACAGLPNVSAAPLPKGVPLSSAVDVIVYRVTGASNADIARLQVCLTKFPSVQGINLQDSSDNS